MKRFNAHAQFIFKGAVAMLVRSMGMYDTEGVLHARELLRLLHWLLQERLNRPGKMIIYFLGCIAHILCGEAAAIRKQHPALRLFRSNKLQVVFLCLFKYFNSGKNQFKRILAALKCISCLK